MKKPNRALLLLERNQIYPIDVIHFDTCQVTLKESEKVYNTVSVNNVIFDYSGFSIDEINMFQKSFKK